MSSDTCDWCHELTRSKVVVATKDRQIQTYILCDHCHAIALHALELASEVAQLTQKGGMQLYIGVERTGQNRELVSVKRWSPLEPLENADFVAELLPTSQ